MTEIIRSATLIFILLNPFLLVVYMTDVMRDLSFTRFAKILIRAGLISFAVFSVFAVVGDVVFADVVQADFASFEIFGGIVFLLIGIHFVFKGNAAIETLRGDSEHLAGAIAMPILVGPGTISASVLTGQRLPSHVAIPVIAFAVGLSICTMILLKYVHDYVRPRNERLIERYVEIAGRVTALFVGTISIQMIMRGLSDWVKKFH